jgi:hypothetical protein
MFSYKKLKTVEKRRRPPRGDGGLSTNMLGNPEEMKSIVEHREVPKEEAAVDTVAVLEDRYGDRYLAVGCHRQPNKWTQGDGGSRKKFAAVCGKLICRGIPAPRKNHAHQGPGRDKAARGTAKGRTFRTRSSPRPKRNNGIKDS